MSKKTVQLLQGALIVVLIVIVSFFSIEFLGDTGLIYSVVGLFLGLACANMASNRGRSWPAGLLSGFFFGVLTVFYYAIVGDTVELKMKKEHEARKKYAE